MSSQIFDWKQFARHSFSPLGEYDSVHKQARRQLRRVPEPTASLSLAGTMDDYRNSPRVKCCADLFPSDRCPPIKFKKGLERENLLIAKAYLPVNNMNCM